MEDSSESRSAQSLVFAAAGLAYGCLVGNMALGLAGGGHGWYSAAVSGSAVVLIPAFGAALALPRQRRRSSLSLVGAAALTADLFLALGTCGEGLSYVWKVWAAAPGGVILWAALWGAWQLAVLGVLIYDTARTSRAA